MIASDNLSINSNHRTIWILIWFDLISIQFWDCVALNFVYTWMWLQSNNRQRILNRNGCFWVEQCKDACGETVWHPEWSGKSCLFYFPYISTQAVRFCLQITLIFSYFRLFLLFHHTHTRAHTHKIKSTRTIQIFYT